MVELLIPLDPFCIHVLMHIQIIISLRLYRAQYLHGMRYPYLLLLLNFVLLSLMSGCMFKLAQLLLFYVPVYILLHEPFIEKKTKKKQNKKTKKKRTGWFRRWLETERNACFVNCGMEIVDRR